MPESAGRAYLDHASTSPLRPEAASALIDWLSAADPGRVHTEGRMARFALEDAREEVAALLGTRPRQVIFTSGATEAINAAVFGALWEKPGRVVCGAVEHSAVRESSERWGAGVVEIGCDREGLIDVAEVEAALSQSDRSGAVPPVRLVHCQLANHEVGTIQPVAEIAQLCRAHGVMLHVDAAAAAGHLRVAFDEMGADFLSVSAHKLGGPKGAGAMLVRRGLRVAPLILGGAQERARRGGLENVAAAIGFGAAARTLGNGGLDREAVAARQLTDRLRAAVSAIPGVTQYGPNDARSRLPNLVCLGVEGVEAEPVLIGLDQAGVAAHSGSSCASESLQPSPVLEAMGVDAQHSLRLSVGWSSSMGDVERAVRALPDVVERLRRLGAG